MKPSLINEKEVGMVPPGFTAEASLYTSSRGYSLAGWQEPQSCDVVAQWWPTDCEGLLAACLAGAAGMCGLWGICVAAESPLNPLGR